MNILEDVNYILISNKNKISYRNNIVTLSDIEEDKLYNILTYKNPKISYSDNILEIHLDGLQDNTKVYYDEYEFIRLNEEFDINSLNENIVILFYKNKQLIRFNKNDYNDNSNYFVTNQIAYNKFIKLFSSKIFADDYNEISHQILLYSLDKGIYKIKFPSPAPFLDDSTNFQELVNLFSTKYNSTDFILHFKNQLYNLPIIAEEDRIQYIVKVLSELMHDADMEHQLFSKKFSFKKLRSELREEKETYFKSLTEVLTKITNQIISVPISISAAILASYKSEGWIQILILLVFWGYTFFVLNVHNLYLKDVKDLDNSLEKDFDIILRDSGHNQEEINSQKGLIKARITKIQEIISGFKFSFIGIGVALTIYIILKMLNENEIINHGSSNGLLAF